MHCTYNLLLIFNLIFCMVSCDFYKTVSSKNSHFSNIQFFLNKHCILLHMYILHNYHITFRFTSNSKSFFSSSLDRAGYPEELAKFVRQTESVSTCGNKSKGEDMDACLEELNKDSKV